MRACTEDVFGTTYLEGRTVAVQGLGQVGYHPCRLLHDAGAHLMVADLEPEAAERMVQEFGAKALEPDEILFVPCDILAPCALGAVLNDETLPRLRCRIIAGGANNILDEASHGEAWPSCDILYAPDYVINAGGLINVADELEGYNERRARGRVMGIEESLRRIIAISRRDGVPTNVAAGTLALKRIAAISSMERLHTGHHLR